jgi:hypothetical protein
VGHGVSTPEEAGVLQECLDNLVKWAEDWGMLFNAEKCKVMHVGRSNQRFQYSMGGVVLGETEEEKDVGVTINKSLKPSGQCTRAANTARGVLGQVTYLLGLLGLLGEEFSIGPLGPLRECR